MRRKIGKDVSVVKPIELVLRENAFRIYRRVRDLKKVAEYPGMPDVEVLKVWKEEDKWDERIREIEDKLETWGEVLKKLEGDAILRDDVFYYMLLNKILETTIKSMIEKRLEPENWKEAMETIKFVFDQKRLLAGRPQVKAEVGIDMIKDLGEEQIRIYLKQIANLLSNKTSEMKAITSEIEKKIEKEVMSNQNKFLEEIEE
ncbi:MAG: hypothetical protein QXT86_11560 [Archaeoglobaceae archaeon]